MKADESESKSEEEGAVASSTRVSAINDMSNGAGSESQGVRKCNDGMEQEEDGPGFPFPITLSILLSDPSEGGALGDTWTRCSWESDARIIRLPTLTSQRLPPCPAFSFLSPRGQRRWRCVCAANVAHALPSEAAKKCADAGGRVQFTITYDVLVRAGLTVQSAYVGSSAVSGTEDPHGSKFVTCSRGIRIVPDLRLPDLAGGKSLEEYDAVVVPGGNKGAEIISTNEDVTTLLGAFYGKGKLVACICAGTCVVACALALVLHAHLASIPLPVTILRYTGGQGGGNWQGWSGDEPSLSQGRLGEGCVAALMITAHQS